MMSSADPNPTTTPVSFQCLLGSDTVLTFSSVEKGSPVLFFGFATQVTNKELCHPKLVQCFDSSERLSQGNYVKCLLSLRGETRTILNANRVGRWNAELKVFQGD